MNSFSRPFLSACQFSFRRALLLHKRIHVKKELMFHCLKCGASFTELESLLKHLFLHTSGYNSEFFQCMICNAVFGLYQQLCQHSQQIHKSINQIILYGLIYVFIMEIQTNIHL